MLQSQHRPRWPVAGSGTIVHLAFTRRKQARKKTEELCMCHLDPRTRSCVRVRKLHVPCTKVRKESWADCCRHPKVCQTDTQNAVCATYMDANSCWRIVLLRRAGRAFLQALRMTRARLPAFFHFLFVFHVPACFFKAFFRVPRFAFLSSCSKFCNAFQFRVLKKKFACSY